MRAVTFVAWAGPALSVIGTALVGAGLYRRDSAAQRVLRRIVSKLVGFFRLGRRTKTVNLSGAASGSSALHAEVSKSPPSREPDASTDARLEWLEKAVDLLMDQLDDERRARREGDRRTEDRIESTDQQLSESRRELEWRIEEVTAPERLEWWGLAFLLAGAALSSASAFLR